MAEYKTLPITPATKARFLRAAAQKQAELGIRVTHDVFINLLLDAVAGPTEAELALAYQREQNHQDAF